jgi:hypothetical protein
MALAGATWRCFALLAFPARRDEDLRGALGIGGGGRGGVWVGRSGGVGLLPGPRLPLRPLTLCGGASLIGDLELQPHSSMSTVMSTMLLCWGVMSVSGSLAPSAPLPSECIGTLYANWDFSGGSIDFPCCGDYCPDDILVSPLTRLGSLGASSLKVTGGILCQVTTYTGSHFNGTVSTYGPGDYRGNGAFDPWLPRSMRVHRLAPALPPSAPPPASGAIIELTGDRPRVIFGTITSPVCELVLNRASNGLESTCHIETGSRRLEEVHDQNKKLIMELAEVKAELAHLKELVADLKTHSNSGMN